MPSTESIRKKMTIRGVDLSPLIDLADFERIQAKIEAQLQETDLKPRQGEKSDEWKVYHALAENRDDLENQNEILLALGFLQAESLCANRNLYHYCKKNRIETISHIAMALGLSIVRSYELVNEIRTIFDTDIFNEKKSGGRTKSRAAKGNDYYSDFIDWDVARRFHCKVEPEDAMPAQASTDEGAGLREHLRDDSHEKSVASPTSRSTADAIQQKRHSEFITSRGFVLPDDSEDLAVRSWFNMWKPRRWPYNELKVGDTLYWYDSKLQVIVWKTSVIEVARFQYGNKEEARERLLQEYGEDPFDDPYFVQASDHGYCLAFKVHPLERLSLPKPGDYTFPYGGWLRCENPDAQAWLSQLSTKSQDSSYTFQLKESASKAANEGYFEPTTLEDERERKLTGIVQRRGQPGFRNQLIAAYDGQCAITGCDAVSALEAAHITPYLGPESNHVSNGLFLRADIHTLFDLDLLGIDPESLKVVVAEALRKTCYEEMDGQELTVPDDVALAPSKEALQQRWERFQFDE